MLKIIGITRNLSRRGHYSWEGALPDPRMATVILSIKVLGRKNKENWHNFLLKMYFGILGRLLPLLCSVPRWLCIETIYST